jgi:hypothetical protein
MKKTILFIFLILILSFSLSMTAYSQTTNNNDNSDKFNLTLSFEAGFLGALHHTIQFGDSGTRFNYIEEGSQNIIFLFERYTANLNLFRKHSIVFLYQPLTLQTQAVANRDIQIEDVIFSTGTGLNLTYEFSFWRASYLYHIIENNHLTWAAGVSLQIRSASIIFESTEGDNIVVNQNIGPVPILKTLLEYRLINKLFLGLEIDGFYASAPIANGSDISFVGYIIDASIRAGYDINNDISTFFNIRLLGGGADGYEGGEVISENYTYNMLFVMTFTLGFYYRL